jgi:hypothetical protein
MHHCGLKDLMGVFPRSVFVLLDQTAGAIQLIAAEVLGSIKSQQELVREEALVNMASTLSSASAECEGA